MKIAIIPARGGSKRIPRKNIREFCGKPIISFAIEAARSSGLFDHIIVSTDDVEIADISIQFGAEIPFMRSSEFSKDETSTDAMLINAVRECSKVYGDFEFGCCIYPTCPFLTPIYLQKGFDMLVENRATSLFPVTRYDFPIEQAFVLDGIKPIPKWPEKLNVRSQDLKPCFHDAGIFYWFNVEKFLKVSQLFSNDSIVFEIPSDRVQDINSEEDWHKAQIKFRIISEMERK